jgi:hypothetical protein
MVGPGARLDLDRFIARTLDEQDARRSRRASSTSGSSRSPVMVSVKCFGNGLRVLCRHSKQGQRRPIRSPSRLFPVAQRGHTHPDHQGELRLRHTELRPDRAHVCRLKDPRSRRLRGATPDAAGLTHAGEQFLKSRVLHLNSSRRQPVAQAPLLGYGVRCGSLALTNRAAARNPVFTLCRVREGACLCNR